MSRSTRSRRSASTRRNAAEEVTMLDDIAFEPTAICGGRLSTSDYNLRSRKCTEDQLERLKATPEFKTWEREHGAGASPSWAARLEQVKALLPPSLVPYSKTVAIVSIVTLLLIVPMLFPLATKGGGITAPAAAPTSAVVKGKTSSSSSSVRGPAAAPVATPRQQKTEDKRKEELSSNPSAAAVNEDSAQQQQQQQQRRKEKELAEAKQAAAAAQEQQRQLTSKLEEASKREAALIEETKRLTAALAAKKPTNNNNNLKTNLLKAFTISGGGRGEALKPPSQTGKSPKALLQYAVYYLASLGPDIGLLTIEAGLLILAAVLMLGLRKSRQAAEQVKKEYLTAYRRQMALFAKAEESYEAAYAAQSKAEKMAIEAREAAAAGSSASGSAVDASAAAAAAAAAEALTKATEKKEQELQAKEKQLENRLEEIKASAAAQTSAWAAAAAQLLQLASSSPSKNNKNQPQQKSRLSKSSSSTPPSPGTVVNAVTDKYSQLRVRLTSAEAAATDAATVADTARREREHSEQRVSEMITDNELLKERLADTKKALAVATDAKAAAELHEAEVRAALETTQQNLATVQAEKEELTKEVQTLKESLNTASDKVAAAVKGGDHLEAQVDQLTVSLGDESAQKQRAEQRCAQLEGDLSALQILADSLQNQVSALEQRLEESLAAQNELKFASKQLEAAHAAAVAAASSPNPTPALVQRALNEESAALEQLNTAERRAAEASSLTSFALSGGEDVAPRPILPQYTTTTGSYPPTSPQQINSARASSLIARAGKIASMLSEGMDGLLGGGGGGGSDIFNRSYSTKSGVLVSSALSARGIGENSNGLNQQQGHVYSARRRSIESTESGSWAKAHIARASELFSAAEQYLGQELPSLSSSTTTSISDAGKRPYRDIPLLLADARVNLEVVNGTRESSGVGRASSDEAMTRFVAAVNGTMKEAEILQSSLVAQNTTPEYRTAAENLSSCQVKVAAALEDAATTTKTSEQKREGLAYLAEIAREKQRELEDAQLALTAAMEESDKETSTVAAAAEHLQAAEKAQVSASEAVYQAERDMHAAVSAQLKAREVLKREHEVMKEAFAAATGLLGGSGEEALDALSVSPILSIGLEQSAPKDVFD